MVTTRRLAHARLAMVTIALAIGLAAAPVGAHAEAGTGGRAPGAGNGSGKLRGFLMKPAPAVGTLALPDAAAAGAETTFVAAPHDLLLVYFGYTSCPDICPTTLSDLGVALRRLGKKKAERVEVAMVTVDPERDTGPVLSGYLEHFLHSGYHALRTDDPVALKTVADAFGAKYEVSKSADGEIEVGHSALVYAVDDQGEVVVAWPFGTSTSALVHDLRVLVSRA